MNATMTNLTKNPPVGKKRVTGPQADDPCAGDTGCLVPPAEFVRLRYFFGQRLNVVDLTDEQSYVVGKLRFHNLRAHGAGVLCGLLAERYVYPQGSGAGSQTTLLRVSRGGALDPCGREIIVGWDQCIDVAAWFAQHPAAQGDVDKNGLHLWVVLCYRECPSDPAPAPRDPCGCDANGCEYARIREGFELKLITDSEALELTGGKHFSLADGLTEEASGQGGSAFGRVAERFAFECSGPPKNQCLFLAAFEATLDAAGKKIIDIGKPDNTIPERLTLLPVSMLQQGLVEAMEAMREAELIGAGPVISSGRFQTGGPDSGTYSIGLETRGSPLSRDPFAKPTQLDVNVSQFKDTGDWAAVKKFTTSYAPGPPMSIDIQFASGQIAEGRYRVYLKSDQTQPPVDQKMQPLTPTSWAHHFRLVKDSSGNLVLADSLY